MVYQRESTSWLKNSIEKSKEKSIGVGKTKDTITQNQP